MLRLWHLPRDLVSGLLKTETSSKLEPLHKGQLLEILIFSALTKTLLIIVCYIFLSLLTCTNQAI